MPIEEFRKRAREAIMRGDQSTPVKKLDLEVPYSKSFDVFAANTAYSIRGEVVYRSDGGVFARGFVRQTGDLLDIHKELVKVDLRDGSVISMTGSFWRRQDPKAQMRWARSIRFEIDGIYNEEDKNSITFTEDEGEHNSARPDVVENLHKKLADDILVAISDYANNNISHNANKPTSDRARRLGDWVHLAYSMGYPAFTNLWYYNGYEAWYYVRWETKPSERKTMTAQTNGAMPFDGESGYPRHTAWRRYPFRELMTKCVGLDADRLQSLAAETMRLAEEEIFSCISEINRELRRVVPAGSTSPYGLTGAPSANLGDEADKFVQHFVSLLKDNSTLYGTYMSYSQSWTWIDTISGYH